MVLPLALLELINVPQATEDFPIRLFAMMFGNALLAAACVVPALLELIKFRGVSALKGIHWAGLMAGVLLLWAFGSVVTDQWSCFIGIPNCD
jgi:hypothetical protein